MPIWIIEPHDPLIFRDGRPFGPDPGVTASTLPFPFPSTTTGAARSRAATDANGDFRYPYDPTKKNDPQNEAHAEKLRALTSLQVRGPLLVRLSDSDDDIDQQETIVNGNPDKRPCWLMPAPADAVLFRADSDTRPGSPLLHQMAPLAMPAETWSDLDKHKKLVGLVEFEKQQHPVTRPETLLGKARFIKEKPLPNAPRFWLWSHFERWLIAPNELVKEATSQAFIDQLGLVGLRRDQRVHVRMNPERKTGLEGMLFETHGLEFTAPGPDTERLSRSQRLALVVDVEESDQPEKKEFRLHEGMDSLGSERRMVHWRKSERTLPICPDDLAKAIAEHAACRLILLTPAAFKAGYLPDYLGSSARSRYQITLDVQGSVVQRPQVISGWDLKLRGPKPTRPLSPAGSVYFLTLEGEKEQIRAWVRETWMQCISDEPQDRHDGFGLAVLGTWNGKDALIEEDQFGEIEAGVL